MKEVFEQYGQSVIAVVIAILLITIIGGAGTGRTHGIYVKVGEVMKQQDSTGVENAEFERYWRLR